MIKGLRARGGFEVKEMGWVAGKLTKVVIRSTIGGNLRLRVPDQLKGQGFVLKPAKGSNPNVFYTVAKTPDALLSENAITAEPVLRETFLYDIPTVAGKSYTLVLK